MMQPASKVDACLHSAQSSCVLLQQLAHVMMLTDDCINLLLVAGATDHAAELAPSDLYTHAWHSPYLNILSHHSVVIARDSPAPFCSLATPWAVVNWQSKNSFFVIVSLYT
jgi:hypothetical protein